MRTAEQQRREKEMDRSHHRPGVLGTSSRFRSISPGLACCCYERHMSALDMAFKQTGKQQVWNQLLLFCNFAFLLVSFYFQDKLWTVRVVIYERMYTVSANGPLTSFFVFLFQWRQLLCSSPKKKSKFCASAIRSYLTRFGCQRKQRFFWRLIT